LRGEIKVKEMRETSKRAGNIGERVKRFREKKPPREFKYSKIILEHSSY
jgi:hypothetical protein